MEYCALYRKLRPETFEDVIGQEHITTTLINQIKTGRVGHAYLFSGSRGVGKTTCARIFAKAINCTAAKDGSPCHTCAVCKNLDNANNIDVTEIDAASNNGVDDARELRERVKYPPVYGKYKVFIIDEVHMLTGSAFNALLKTLEEPPPHAVFILATTEPHKLPATILSRCMRFDFRLLSTALLEQLISKAYTAEGKKFQKEAVRYIAICGEGSARDALSIADKCLSASAGELRYEDVLNIMGAADKSKILTLVRALSRGETGAALEACHALIHLGLSVQYIGREIALLCRNLLFAMTAPDALEVPDQEKERLAGFARECRPDFAAAVLQIFAATEPELRYAAAPRIVLETAIVRACKLLSTDLSALEERIARLEKLAAAGVPAMQMPVSDTAGKPEAAEALPDKKVVWGKIITFVRTHASKLAYNLISSVQDVELKDGQLTVYGDNNTYLSLSSEEVTAQIKEAIRSLGYPLELTIDKRKQNTDMDKEILKIKSMIGKTPFEAD